MGTEFKKTIVEFRISAIVYRVSFKTKFFAFFGPNLPKKDIFGTEFMRTNVELRIIILEYLHVLSLIWNKLLWSFGTKFDQKRWLRTKFRKIKSHTTLFWISIKWFTKFWVSDSLHSLVRPASSYVQKYSLFRDLLQHRLETS